MTASEKAEELYLMFRITTIHDLAKTYAVFCASQILVHLKEACDTEGLQDYWQSVVTEIEKI